MNDATAEKPDRHSIRSQLRRNAVALISLVVAITSLGYNTWRNEVSEYNRNQRQAAFEVLLKLGEIEEVVNYSHFDPGTAERGNPRTGWALVKTMRDIAEVLEAPVPAAADQLFATWQAEWRGLGKRDSSVDAIRGDVDRVRDETLELLRDLD